MAGGEPSQPKATLLVVDDEAAVRRVLVMRLQLAGYRVVCAEDGEQALELFHREAPDLVVLDVMLPKLPVRRAQNTGLEKAPDPRGGDWLYA